MCKYLSTTTTRKKSRIFRIFFFFFSAKKPKKVRQIQKTLKERKSIEFFLNNNKSIHIDIQTSTVQREGPYSSKPTRPDNNFFVVPGFFHTSSKKRECEFLWQSFEVFSGVVTRKINHKIFTNNIRYIYA